MSQPESKPTAIFTSWYQHGVDEKRRVQIPAKWRPEQEGAELTVMLWPQHQAGACLRVLSPDQLAKLIATIEQMPQGDPSKLVLKRLIGSGTMQLNLDKVGRIVLPDCMAKPADITTEAILVGCIQHYEIWSPARYENVKALDAALSAEAFRLVD